MADKNYNSVNPETGTVVYSGPSELTKGNHANMPSRTDAYLETDERGHVQASSLGGSNSRDNVVPQSADLNHGAYYSMEKGERNALNNGSTIQSEKTAYASNQPGRRPDAFMVNDTITYPDGHTQNVHLSFANLTNAEQEGVNVESSAEAADIFGSQPNPGDSLRANMSATEYGTLMEETDAALPNINNTYEEHISVGYSDETSAEWDYDNFAGIPEDTMEAESDWDFDITSDVSSVEVGGTDDGTDVSVDDE